jgi:hypothetical protein
MVGRKTIVLKPRLDQAIITQVAAKLKNRLFIRLKIFKPKPSDVQLVSIEKVYEHYLVSNGKYSLDYCNKLVYTLEVHKNAQKVFISNDMFKPSSPVGIDSSDYKIIKLNGVATFHHDNEYCLILDHRGREISSQKLRTVLAEEWPKETLKKSGLKKKLSKPQISSEEEIESLRSKLAKRPPDVGEVIKEVFEINQRNVIYIPIYKLGFKNIKTGKKAILEINSMTAETIITTFNEKKVSSKMIAKLITDAHKNLRPIEIKPERNSSLTNSTEYVTKPKETVASRLRDALKPEIQSEEDSLRFPARVVGDVFCVGDKVTAIVGDLEIPSGTIVYETLVVKGNLTIGKNCKILGSIKALGTIVIGDNTIIKGNAVSNKDISIGPKVVIRGQIIFKKALYSTSSTMKDGVNG